MVKNLPANAGDTRDVSLTLGPEDPLERKWLPSPVFLPGKLHGQRSIVVYTVVHGVAKSRTQLSTHAHTHTHTHTHNCVYGTQFIPSRQQACFKEPFHFLYI